MDWKDTIALIKRKELATKFAENVPQPSQFNPSTVRGNFHHENYDYMMALQSHIKKWEAIA